MTFATSPATKSTRGRVQFLLADKTETLNDNGVENSVGRWQMAVGTFLEKLYYKGPILPQCSKKTIHDTSGGISDRYPSSSSRFIPKAFT